jgi:hypothetical protein
MNVIKIVAVVALAAASLTVGGCCHKQQCQPASACQVKSK